MLTAQAGIRYNNQGLNALIYQFNKPINGSLTPLIGTSSTLVNFQGTTNMNSEIVPLPTGPRFLDRTGRVYSWLTVISYAGKNPGQPTQYWSCRCRCGQVTRVAGNNLTRGHTKSCGCMNRVPEKPKSELVKFKEKYGVYKSKHPLYKIWGSMKERCLCKSHHAYHRYGGRGITVSNAWRDSFEQFLDDMGPRPEGYTLERSENDKGYSAENCKWASREEQAQNVSTNALNADLARRIQKLHDNNYSISAIRHSLSIRHISHDTVKNAATRHTWANIGD